MLLFNILNAVELFIAGFICLLKTIAFVMSFDFYLIKFLLIASVNFFLTQILSFKIILRNTKVRKLLILCHLIYNH